MRIRVICPACRASHTREQALPGTSMTCPSCRQTFPIDNSTRQRDQGGSSRLFMVLLGGGVAAGILLLLGGALGYMLWLAPGSNSPRHSSASPTDDHGDSFLDRWFGPHEVMGRVRSIDAEKSVITITVKTT